MYLSDTPIIQKSGMNESAILKQLEQASLEYVKKL